MLCFSHTVINKAPTVFKSYQVLMTFKYPAWDEKNGVTFDVRARSKAEAVKAARRQASDEGHTGVRYFKATEVVQA